MLYELQLQIGFHQVKYSENCVPPATAAKLSSGKGSRDSDLPSDEDLPLLDNPHSLTPQSLTLLSFFFFEKLKA